VRDKSADFVGYDFCEVREENGQETRFSSEQEMNVIKTPVELEPFSSSEQVRDVEQLPQPTTLAPPLTPYKELSEIIGRLVTETLVEANAAVERALAAGQCELEAAKAALEEQTRRNEALSISLGQSDFEIAELRSKLQVERENTKSAIEEHERAQRAHAEMAYEHSIREQLVAAYESRLRDVHVELDAMRAAFSDLRQQREAEAAEHARLITALKTVQQTCAVAESQTSCHENRLSDRPDNFSATQNHETSVAIQTGADETRLRTLSVAPRTLKLAARNEPPPLAASPQLTEYLKGLFEQISTMYWVDVQAHASADVLDRLCANVRYAREAFIQRARGEGANGADLFDGQLSAKLDEFGTTSLGRHLSIAAYELTSSQEANVRAEAS